MTDVKVSHEGKRGCGYRKPGGIYLMADGELHPCGRLPIPLGACPVCGEGIKPARGWTWVGSELLTSKLKDKACGLKECPGCTLHDPENLPFEKAGLLWVGEKFYKTPDKFMDEAKEMGLSRRVNQLPHHFKLGETWVLLAHRFAIGQGKEARPGIFTLFKPERIEQVLKGTESEAEIQKIVKRGFVPVIVKKLEERPKDEEEGL